MVNFHGENPLSFCLFISNRYQWGAQFKTASPSQWVRITHFLVVCRFHRVERTEVLLMSLIDLKILKKKILFFNFQCRKNTQEIQNQIQYCTLLYITKFVLLAKFLNKYIFIKTDLQWWYFSVKKGERLKIDMWLRKQSISAGVFFFMSRCFIWICNLTDWSCNVLVSVDLL